MKPIETARLVLRPWREDDAEALYEYARDPRVGPAAGWQPHASVADSCAVIRDILAPGGSYAVTLKGCDRPIGSVGFKASEAPGHEADTEIGYWIAVPFWGRGLIPEAVRALLRLAFAEQNLPRVWCGHYAGNDKSRRVIEKCGFRPAIVCEKEVPLLSETRTEHFYYITKEDFEHGELSCPGGVRRG